LTIATATPTAATAAATTATGLARFVATLFGMRPLRTIQGEIVVDPLGIERAGLGVACGIVEVGATFFATRRIAARRLATFLAPA
jgi:hypothetical protein